MISGFLLKIYNVKNLEDFKKIVLIKLNSLVPFSLATFYQAQVGQFRPSLFNATVINNIEIDIDLVRKKIKEYDQLKDYDYANFLLDSKQSIVYRDSDLLHENHRKETIVYKRIFAPFDYISGVVMVMDGELLGQIILYRHEDSVDFTDKEIYILNQLEPHITNCLHKMVKQCSPESLVDPTKLISYQLTKRELEIVELICKGYSNYDIADELYISEHTVKKHITNIFSKTTITNRARLISHMLSEK